MVQSLWKTVLWFLKRVKIELPCGSTVPFLGVYLKEIKILPSTSICTCIFIAALFTMGKGENNPNAYQQMKG